MKNEKISKLFSNRTDKKIFASYNFGLYSLQMVTSKCGNIWRNPANRIFPFPLLDYVIRFFLKEQYRHRGRRFLIFPHCGHPIFFIFLQLQGMNAVRFSPSLNNKS